MAESDHWDFGRWRVMAVLTKCLIFRPWRSQWRRTFFRRSAGTATLVSLGLGLGGFCMGKNMAWKTWISNIFMVLSCGKAWDV